MFFSSDVGTRLYVYAYSNNEVDTAQFADDKKDFISAKDLLDLYQDNPETNSPATFLEGLLRRGDN